MTPHIRVLIAEDQPLVREGFRQVLSRSPDLEVVGEAADGAQAVALVRRLRPDVIVMDIRMPVLDGLAATEQILADLPDVRVLVLTTFGLDEYAFRALRAGASGFLLKDTPLDEIAAAIRVVYAGEGMLSPRVTASVIREFARRPAPSADVEATLGEVTPRERDVLRRLARGMTNAEIAAELVLAPATVKSHVRSMLTKLRMRDRTQLVIAAYECGFAWEGRRLPGPPMP